MIKIEGGGRYIFDLVGEDYNDADSRTKKAIAALFKKYGEYRICQLAADYVDEFSGVSLRSLLKSIAERAELLPIKPLEEQEGDYY